MNDDVTRPTHGVSSGDVRRDMSPDQLRGIGEVAMAYNITERTLDFVLMAAMSLDHMWTEVLTRINGSDGKIGILNKYSIEVLGASINKTVSDTMSAFGTVKKHRDDIIHSIVYNNVDAVADRIARQGKLRSVLLTPAFLNGVYERLVIVNKELVEIYKMFSLIRSNQKYYGIIGRRFAGAPIRDPNIPTLEQEVQACVVQLQSHQKTRKSLPQLPKILDRGAG